MAVTWELFHNLTSVFAVIGGIVALLYFVFKPGIWVRGVNDIKEDVVILKEDVKGLKEDVKGLKVKVDKILKYLLKDEATILSDSPLRLSEREEKISVRLDARSMVREHAKALLSQAKGKSKFDIQQLSMDFIDENYKQDPNQAIKACAYDHGIDIDQVLAVLAIELRDELFRLIGED